MTKGSEDGNNIYQTYLLSYSVVGKTEVLVPSIQHVHNINVIF